MPPPLSPRVRTQNVAQSVVERVGDPQGFLLLRTSKPNSGLPKSNPTDGSVVRTIKTDDIGTLTHGKKKENISHGRFD